MARTKTFLSRTLADSLDRLAHSCVSYMPAELLAHVQRAAQNARQTAWGGPGGSKPIGRGVTALELAALATELTAYTHSTWSGSRNDAAVACGNEARYVADTCRVLAEAVG